MGCFGDPKAVISKIPPKKDSLLSITQVALSFHKRERGIFKEAVLETDSKEIVLMAFMFGRGFPRCECATSKARHYIFWRGGASPNVVKENKRQARKIGAVVC